MRYTENYMIPRLRALSAFAFLASIVVLFGGFGFIRHASAQSTLAPCANWYDKTKPVSAGYGAAYDIVEGSAALLIQVRCDLTVPRLDVGRGSVNDYVYKTAWLYPSNGTSWQQIDLTSTSALDSTGNWYPGSAQTSLPSSLDLSSWNYVAGFVCTWTGSLWKCGCADQACAASYWQLQMFRLSPASTSSTSSGNSNSGGNTGSSSSITSGAASIWHPALNTSWQWQLTTPVDQSIAVTMYDIDLFENAVSVISSLHVQGRKVVCYFNAGAYENWRPDASQFPASVLGNSNGWPGEMWLDIRNLDVLGPIMKARLDMAVQKGCDGVEPDNIDGYANSSGFPLTTADQAAFNEFIANEAHARNLSVGLKNDLDQIPALLSYFDWALNEQCFQYGECGKLQPFIDTGKAVFNVEYNLATSAFCPQANVMNFNSLKKNLNLDATRAACR